MIASWLLNPNIGRAMMPKGTVGELAQEPGHDFPVVIANMPASAAERRVAFALIVLLFIVFGMVAPFARVPLPRVEAFIPVIQTVVCVAELVTAILLFAQYSSITAAFRER
jgi:hypothetical protein